MAKTKKTPRQGKKRTAGQWVKRILTGTALVVLFALVAGLAMVGIVYAKTAIPDPNKEFTTNTSFVYFNDGTTKLGSLSVQNRQSIPYDKMPQSMKDATIAAENRTFWTDRGISITGMIRAAMAIAGGGEMQGGSTITQQYIKILYLNSDRTVTRKFKELFLAAKLGREVPKEQILEGYLNTIYFGRGAYGVQAAAKAYFNVDAEKLTVPQSAFLATVLNSPGLYEPGDPDDQQRIIERYHYVIDGMVEMGKLTPEEGAKYRDQLPEFPEVPVNQQYGGDKGFLLKMVEAELAAKGMSQAQIAGGGLKIVTSFDQKAQAAAVATGEKYRDQVAKNAGKKELRDPNLLHPTIASVDNATGEVIALYGGSDYLKNQRNWATTPRQTGSTFKTFALAAGLRDGFNLYSTFNGDTFTPKGDKVPVRNEFSQQYGDVNLVKATADSINTAFVDMTVQMKDGTQKIAQAANDAGAPTGPGWDTATSRFSLGIAEVSPVAMAGAYATFANNGRHVPPHVVREVFDAKGRSLYKADTQGKQVFDSGLARDVTYALSNVVDEGTGARVASLNRPIAGKTGTAGVNDDIIAAWFVAYTKQVSTSVMFVAGDAGTSDLDPYARSGDQTFFGGTYPAMVWADYMRVVMKGKPVLQFDKPAFVNRNKARNGNTSIAPRTAAPSTAAPAKTAAPSEAPISGAPTSAQSESSQPQPSATRPQPTKPAPSSQPTTAQTQAEQSGDGSAQGQAGGSRPRRGQQTP